MDLSGKQLEQLQLALLKAFPTKSALQQFVLFKFELNMDEFTDPGPLENVVFTLLQWFQAHGQLSKLVPAALDARPDNQFLRTFVEQSGISEWQKLLADLDVQRKSSRPI